MRPIASALLLACALAACSKSPPPPAESDTASAPVDAGTAGPIATTTGSAPRAPSAKKPHHRPKKSAAQPLSKGEDEALRTYLKWMGEGRKATRDKRFPEAIAAFDKAVVALPDDARAYGERGYARVLARDFKEAVKDLDRAASRTQSPKLLASVWFNYGLAAEGTGDAEKARAAFARSNALRPTKAAADKLAGKSACTAAVDTSPGNADATFDGWKAAYESERASDDTLPAWSGDASLHAVCGDDFKTGDPCLRISPSVIAASATLWQETPDGKVLRRDLGMAGGRCGGTVEAKLASGNGGVIHVEVRVEQGLSVLLMEKNGEMVPCEGDAPCSSACGEPTVTIEDLFVDAASGKRLLSVSRETREGGADPLHVTRADRAVTVKGAGCDQTVTLGAAR